MFILILTLAACRNKEVYISKKDVYYVIGDSITWQDGHVYGGTNDVAVGYPTLVGESLGFKSVINKGIAGASIAKNKNYPSNGSILLDNDFSDVKNADLVTILVGTNDFKLDVPLGKINNDEERFFYGSYNKLIYLLKKINPKVEIVLVTPLHRDNSNYKSDTINDAGFQLSDYQQAIINIAKKFNLKVIDLYRNSIIQEETLYKYTIDGLHPNNDGYEKISKEMVKFLK